MYDRPALQYAEQRAASKIDHLPERHKDEWRARAGRDVAAAQRNLITAVHQVAAARDQLATEAALAAYLEAGASFTPPIGEGVHILRGDGTLQIVAFALFVAALLAEGKNAADGRHRLPTGVTSPRYANPMFWRGARSEHAEAG